MITNPFDLTPGHGSLMWRAVQAETLPTSLAGAALEQKLKMLIGEVELDDAQRERLAESLRAALERAASGGQMEAKSDGLFVRVLMVESEGLDKIQPDRRGWGFFLVERLWLPEGDPAKCARRTVEVYLYREGEEG